MKTLFHPATLFLLCCCTTSFTQNWFSDDSFLTYYSQEEEIFLSADFSRVDVYFNEQKEKYSVKKLKKKKGYIDWNESDKVLSINLNQIEGLDPTRLNSTKLSQILELPQKNIREIVPSMKVNGRIKATLKNEFIIAFNSSIEPGFMDAVLKRMEGKIISIRPDGSYVIRMNLIKNGFDLMHELAGLDLIEYAQPDMVVNIQHTDDPLFSKQYQLLNTGQYIDGQSTTAGMDLNVVPAWNITKGSGITVVVIDDGIEAHEDLPNIKAGFTPANNGYGTPESTGKHGMAVAGIISAQHNDLGIKGISPDANLLGINIFASGTTLSDYAQSFFWAVDNGADIISNSWGFVYEDVDIESVNPPVYTIRKGAMCSTNPFPALTSAINFAADHGRNGKGCIITFASGNWAQEGPLGQNSDECVTYPGSLEKVLAIGAINPRGEKSIYSDFGPKLDFVAPSNDLNSAGSRSYFGVRTIDREGSSGYSKSNYHSGFGGTSAATPAASGAIALVLSAHPELTRTEVTALLKRTAKDLNTSGFDIRTGNGLINAAEAIKQGGDVSPVDPCVDKGGDSDGDGICDSDDCNPYDSFYPAQAGSACNDHDASTENDTVTSDGCSCKGETVACYYDGGDYDRDGYCLLDDCDDENPNIPAPQGTPCNDNDITTENDIIQSDGCTCQGTLINDNNNNDDNNNDNNEDNEGDQEEEAGCVNPDNIALNGSASQSSTFFTFAASRVIDGDLSKNKYAQTNYSRDPHFDLDLGIRAEMKKINVFLKTTPRTTVFMFISETSMDEMSIDALKNSDEIVSYEINTETTEINMTKTGRYLRLQMAGFQSLATIEMEVYGCEITAYVTDGQNTNADLHDFTFDNGLSMTTYPNPTSKEAYIEFTNAIGKSGELTIYNSLGVKIYHQSMSKIPIIPLHLDTYDMKNGMYVIEMVSDNQRLTEKLIISR